LEDCIDYKLPFTQEEKRLILTRFGSNTDIARKILSIRAEPFKFKTPFKTELLIKRRISDDKSENSLFESIKDKSKFNLTIKNGVMIADDTNKSNRYSVHNLSEAELQKMSKGQFKYLLRIYNHNMFRQHIERLEKAVMFYGDKNPENKASLEFMEKGNFCIILIK